jgi:hypothetical protein
LSSEVFEFYLQKLISHHACFAALNYSFLKAVLIGEDMYRLWRPLGVSSAIDNSAIYNGYLQLDNLSHFQHSLAL